MIHLTDIQQRLSTNQEPKEITEMRENVISAFSNLEFIEEGHIYNIHNPDGSVIEKIPSASAIIHRFEPEADWDDIANNYALKRDLNVDDVKRKWKENNLRATNSGSVHHLYGEMLQNFIRTGDKNVICEAMKPQYEQGYLIPSSGKQDAIMKYWEELFVIDDIYPFMAECKMYMPLGNKYGINEIFCGTADILLAYKKNNKYKLLVNDYKTNASLSSSYNQSNGVTMLPPFDDMIDEPLSHYTIQLSLYSMMLENLGYDVIDRRIIWLKDDGTYEKIKVPYIKDKIIESFKIN